MSDGWEGTDVDDDEDGKDYKNPLDDIAHTGYEDCAYFFGRECDCMVPTNFLDRMREAGYALVPIDKDKRAEGIIR